MLIVLAHERRRILHFHGTKHPTAQQTERQLVEELPAETAPKYLLRDRDAIYGEWFQRRVKNRGFDRALAVPRSLSQNPYAARVIGSIRLERLGHVLVVSAGHLRRLLVSSFQYYHRWRTHLSLAMDGTVPRPGLPPDQGAVVEVPEAGGLHHHHERLAA